MSNRGFEETPITQARAPAEPLQLHALDLDDLVHVEEYWLVVRCHFAGFRKVSSWTAIIRSANDERLAVGARRQSMAPGAAR